MLFRKGTNSDANKGKVKVNSNSCWRNKSNHEASLVTCNFGSGNIQFHLVSRFNAAIQQERKEAHMASLRAMVPRYFFLTLNLCCFYTRKFLYQHISFIFKINKNRH